MSKATSIRCVSPQSGSLNGFLRQSATTSAITEQPVGQRDGHTVRGEFVDQRVAHFGLTSRRSYPPARRITSASCSSSFIRLRASRNWADSSLPLVDSVRSTPPSRSAISSQRYSGHGNAEVLRDRPQRRITLAGHCDHVSTIALIFRRFRRRSSPGRPGSPRSGTPYVQLL